MKICGEMFTCFWGFNTAKISAMLRLKLKAKGNGTVPRRFEKFKTCSQKRIKIDLNIGTNVPRSWLVREGRFIFEVLYDEDRGRKKNQCEAWTASLERVAKTCPKAKHF